MPIGVSFMAVRMRGEGVREREEREEKEEIRAKRECE